MLADDTNSLRHLPRRSSKNCDLKFDNSTDRFKENYSIDVSHFGPASCCAHRKQIITMSNLNVDTINSICQMWTWAIIQHIPVSLCQFSNATYCSYQQIIHISRLEHNDIVRWALIEATFPIHRHTTHNPESTHVPLWHSQIIILFTPRQCYFTIWQS